MMNEMKLGQVRHHDSDYTPHIADCFYKNLCYLFNLKKLFIFYFTFQVFRVSFTIFFLAMYSGIGSNFQYTFFFFDFCDPSVLIRE